MFFSTASSTLIWCSFDAEAGTPVENPAEAEVMAPAGIAALAGAITKRARALTSKGSLLRFPLTAFVLL
ncbi:MAG TPA: hypothetical protein VHY58_14015 [Streptosporangiaceae bacterium]|nr:hypothetical protein [Streptosporangiaceae bacterium]